MYVCCIAPASVTWLDAPATVTKSRHCEIEKVAFTRRSGGGGGGGGGGGSVLCGMSSDRARRKGGIFRATQTPNRRDAGSADKPTQLEPP